MWVRETWWRGKERGSILATLLLLMFPGLMLEIYFVCYVEKFKNLVRFDDVCKINRLSNGIKQFLDLGKYVYGHFILLERKKIDYFMFINTKILFLSIRYSNELFKFLFHNIFQCTSFIVNWKKLLWMARHWMGFYYFLT